MTASQWDADQWMLATPGAVIDTRTGEAVPDPKRCYCTRQTAVPAAPAGTPAPIWQTFLERVTRHAPDLVDYLQRIAGYALTGSDREQCLFFAFGGGGNGKGTFFNTVTAIMGSYAHVANNDLLLATANERHPVDWPRCAARSGDGIGVEAGREVGRAAAKESHGWRSHHRAFHEAGLLHVPAAVHIRGVRQSPPQFLGRG
ncbi:MAG: hypothetical protein IPF57_18250 [Gammaproteobacteria bacterium]|nr:hypothetical protein [Gammaproteobacteria bacterium]